jgi:signal transduction histidine kinase
MNTNNLRTVIVILLLSGSKDLSAQYADHRNRQVDSLERVLATNSLTEEDLAIAYNTLMWGYSTTNIGKTRFYARKAIDLGEKTVYKTLMSDAYRLIGNTYYQISHYDSAMICYEKAIWAIGQAKAGKKQYAKHVFDDALSLIYGSIGNLYNIQGKSVQAIDWYGKALKIFEKWNWNESACIAYSNIGEMYMVMNNDERAEFNYLKAKYYACKSGDSLMVAHTMKHLSQLYFNKHDYGKALAYTDSASAYYSAHLEEAGNKAVILMYKGNIYLEGKNDDRQAETFAREALQIADTLSMPREKSQILALLTSIYMRRNEWLKAEQTALEALATDSTEPSNTMALYKDLAGVYAYLSNPQKVTGYLEKYDALKSEYSNKHFQSSLSEMEVKYETERKETRIAALEGEKRLMTWLSIAGGAVLLLTLASFFSLWRWTVQKKRFAEKQKELAEQQIKQLEQEKQLIATQAVLDGEIQERTRLARDLHDGLGSILAAAKYNLVDIKGISLLGEADVENYRKAINFLDDSMSEMRRIAHHLMPESLGSAGLKQSVADFCNSVPTVRFSYYGDETRFDPKLEVMVYRILHELVSNAVKHAGAKYILVQLVRDADSIALTVQDNGCGFDPSAESKGMGLRNIRTRVESCKGNLDINSGVGEGTEIHVELRIEN